jgi:hypothetical protein
MVTEVEKSLEEEGMEKKRSAAQPYNYTSGSYAIWTRTDLHLGEKLPLHP